MHVDNRSSVILFLESAHGLNGFREAALACSLTSPEEIMNEAARMERKNPYFEYGYDSEGRPVADPPVSCLPEGLERTVRQVESRGAGALELQRRLREGSAKAKERS